MNTQKSSKKTVVIGIAIVGIALAVYFYSSGKAAPANSSLLSTNAVAANQAIGSRVFGLLNQIKSLRIDTSLFKDQIYQSLRDYTVAIPTQNVGRPNPFAPIPGVASPGSSAASGTR